MVECHGCGVPVEKPKTHVYEVDGVRKWANLCEDCWPNRKVNYPDQ
jgi:hypothetical protein